MNKVIPELRSLPIRKTLDLQTVLIQPLFLFKVSHNGEICEDHQQTILKRFLISAPNEALAKHWFILNTLNSVEDLSQFNVQQLNNVFQVLNHRFIKNDNHITLDSRNAGFREISTESIFIKKITLIYPTSCLGYLNSNKILGANFDLAEYHSYISNQAQAQAPFGNNHQSSFAEDKDETHRIKFASLVQSATYNPKTFTPPATTTQTFTSATSTNQEPPKENFAELLAQSPDYSQPEDNENRWNREEFNKNSRPQFGLRSSVNKRFSNQNESSQYDSLNRNQGSHLRRVHNHHPDSAQPQNSGWIQANNNFEPTRHKPFKDLIENP